MKSLMIKDLEISKELSGQELSAVRGGSVTQNVGGAAIVNGGSNLFSTNTAVAANSVTGIDFHPTTDTDVRVLNAVGSLGVFQFSVARPSSRS